MAKSTLESVFTEEDIDKLAYFLIQASVEIYTKPSTSDHLHIAAIIEGLRPYSEISDNVKFWMNELTNYYKEKFGIEYKQVKFKQPSVPHSPYLKKP